MQAYILREGTDVGRITRVDRPMPRPGHGQVLLRMRAWSLNYRDLLVLRGQYSGAVASDVVPVSDGIGEVIETGAGVQRFDVGDRACPTFFQGWIDGDMTAREGLTALGGSIDGLLSEYVVVDEQFAVRPPDHLTDEEAACLPCAGVTAWAALFGSRPVKAGQSVLTLGTGGVSTFAIQFARIAGARVISTSSSDAKLDHARALGATDTINYTQFADWEQEVLRLTEGRGADHVVEVGGGGTLPRSIASAAIGGQVHLIGVLTQGQINPLTLMRLKSLRGIFVGSRTDFDAMNRAVTQHAIRPVVDQVFPFEDVVAAYRHLEGAGHVGKVVIRAPA